MIYDYLLTAFKVIVGLITTERLIYAVAIALGFYLVWIMFSLAFSFQKKFNRNCVKLYNFVKKSRLNANDVNSVDLKASKISSGFSHAWKRFKSSSTGKPSDFITRRDALDVEVTGGVLNQGKSFMRSFINVATFVLFLANFAYLGNSTLISCYLVAESMVLPLLFFVVCKIFYFVYTSVKQQLYKADIECLYELLDLLDSIFAKEGMVVKSVGSGAFVQGEDEIATAEGEELPALEPESVDAKLEENGEQSEEQTDSGEDLVEPEKEELVEPEDVSDKYDFFKKKNLDVDKLINEVPNSSSSLPYINVDSDYVIKDDDAPAVSKTVTNLENGSELLGGMMQDMSSIRKQKDDENKSKDESSEESKEGETEENKTEEKPEEPLAETSDDDKSEDPLASLGDFEIAENAESVETENADAEEAAIEQPEAVEEEEVKLEIPDVAPIDLPEPEVEETLEPEVEEISEEKKDNIAAIVGGFKAKSKLASGGVVIERNEPIARREKVTSYAEPEETSYSEPSYNDSYNNNYVPNAGITHLNAEDNTDNILNSFRSSAGGYEDYPVYNGVQGGMYNQGYNAPQYNQGYGYPQAGFGAPVNQGYGAQGYQGVPQSQGFGGYNQSQDYSDESYDDEIEEYDDEEIEETKPVKKTTKRSKEDEPRPRNLKKKESKTAMAEAIIERSKRGRPKKQVFDETVTIKNDKEFDEVLSRAEKLMKKSESGLSASQAKRIEKELKMLMDAMNKYKEGV